MEKHPQKSRQLSINHLSVSVSISLIIKNGAYGFISFFLSFSAGLKRCGKSCRLRWLNYLRPDIKRGNISPDEEELIIRLHKLLGNRFLSCPLSLSLSLSKEKKKLLVKIY
jgi:hypothetical protein